MVDKVVQNRKSSNSDKIQNLNSIASIKTNSPRLAALLQEADSSKSLTSSPQYVSKLSQIFLNCHHLVWTQDKKKSFSDYFKRLVDFSELDFVEFANEMRRARDFLFATRLLPLYTEIDDLLVSKLCDSSFDTNFVENNRFLLSHLCASIFALKMCTDVKTLKEAQKYGAECETYLDDDY